jgi:hypothetical protein
MVGWTYECRAKEKGDSSTVTNTGTQFNSLHFVY